MGEPRREAHTGQRDAHESAQLAGGDIMTEFLGWIQCRGHRVLVERVLEEGPFHVVLLCTSCDGFERGHELRVPKPAFAPCSPRRD